MNVEGDDAVRPLDVIAARFLVGAAVGDVEGLLVGENASPLGLSKQSAATDSRPDPGS
jgi:hypothetical protein